MAVAGRHQFDDADRGVTREARGFFEFAPAPIICLHLGRKALDELAWADRVDQPCDVADTDVIDHSPSPLGPSSLMIRCLLANKKP